ncbi:septum formation inhibitor Maf [Myxococcota bacterium]|nr:septum formation inhibitor Maf [Myxococcota bacterium]
MQYDLTLASASPRRRQLLEGVGLRLFVQPVEIDERPIPDEAPLRFAQRMAQEKAEAVGASPRPVLASDTVVTFDGVILGKPQDETEAAEMLRRLSGRVHQVITAWTLLGPQPQRGASITDVHFRPLSEAEIQAYVATGEPMDKAGAYGIQGGAGRFVRRIEGSYDGVVGLPLADVLEALMRAGVIEPPFSVAQRAAMIMGRVKAAALAAGRDPAQITLVAVSKRQPIERVREALACGLVHLGENYVQAWESVAFQLGPGVVWHFIGHLQRNKAKRLAGRVDLVHGIDDARVAEALGRAAAALGREIPVLVQVNVAGEASKSGVSVAEAGPLLAAIKGMAGVRPVGLMTLPPEGDPEESRPHFAALRALRDALADEAHPLPELSMGMSDDFEVAIEEGATLIRVGAAIFGPRVA